MKQSKILTTAIFTASLIFSTNSFAISSQQHEFCNELAGLAEIIMKARQMNKPMHQVFKNAEGKLNPKDQALFELIVLGAYEKPLYNTFEYKTKAVSEFRNDTHIACLLGFKDSERR